MSPTWEADTTRGSGPPREDNKFLPLKSSTCSKTSRDGRIQALADLCLLEWSPEDLRLRPREHGMALRPAIKAVVARDPLSTATLIVPSPWLLLPVNQYTTRHPAHTNSHQRTSFVKPPIRTKVPRGRRPREESSLNVTTRTAPCQ